MTSSSGDHHKHNKATVAAVSLLVIMSLSRVQPTSADVSFSCNLEYFPYGDQRILCVYSLLEKLVGDSPVSKGAWYQDEDCVDNSIIYGYRRVDEGATGCIFEAKDVLENTYCHRRQGGRAWGAGCYLRFEIYPFTVEQ